MTDELKHLTDEERAAYMGAITLWQRDLLERLAAERAAHAESERIRDRQREILDAVAVALRGPPPEGVLHDHARLPEEVRALVAALAETRREVGLRRDHARKHSHPCPECHEVVPCLAPSQVFVGERMREDGTIARVYLDGCTIEADLTREDGTLCGGFIVCDECKMKAATAEQRARAERAEAEAETQAATAGSYAQRAEHAEARVAQLEGALRTIERSGAPGGTMVAARVDSHTCGWCRGMVTPCPVMTARAALTPTPEVALCPDCGGRAGAGRLVLDFNGEAVPCPRCQQAPTPPARTVEEVCPTCHGLGYVLDKAATIALQMARLNRGLDPNAVTKVKACPTCGEHVGAAKGGRDGWR